MIILYLCNVAIDIFPCQLLLQSIVSYSHRHAQLIRPITHPKHKHRTRFPNDVHSHNENMSVGIELTVLSLLKMCMYNPVFLCDMMRAFAQWELAQSLQPRWRTLWLAAVGAGACGLACRMDPWYIQARLSVNSLDSFSLAITLAVAVASSFPLTISCLRQCHRHWFAVNTRVSPVSHFPHGSDGLAHKNSLVVDVPSSTCLDTTDSSLVEAPHHFFTATAQIRFYCLLCQLLRLVLSLRLNAFLISIS